MKQTTKENGETIEEFVVIQDDFKYNDTSDVNRFVAFKNQLDIDSKSINY